MRWLGLIASHNTSHSICSRLYNEQRLRQQHLLSWRPMLCRRLRGRSVSAPQLCPSVLHAHVGSTGLRTRPHEQHVLPVNSHAAPAGNAFRALTRAMASRIAATAAMKRAVSHAAFSCAHALPILWNPDHAHGRGNPDMCCSLRPVKRLRHRQMSSPAYRLPSEP